jgi:pimeloyl-ACP methyl ester carboxylesterase
VDHYIIAQDGSRVPYYVTGNGFPVLIFNGFSCHQDNLKYIINCLSKSYTVISWDYKGHGMADSPGDYTYVNINSLIWDAIKIVEELDIKKAGLLGYGLGAELMFEFALRRKDIPVALVSINGLAGNVLSSFFNTDMFAYPLTVLNNTKGLLGPYYSSVWKLLTSSEHIKKAIAQYLFVDTSKFEMEDLDPFIHNLSTMDPNLLSHLLIEFHNHSILNDLPSIKLPTLVVGSQRDNIIPLRRSKELHAMIKNSEFVIIPDGTHNSLLEQHQFLCYEVRSFLHKHRISERSEVSYDI